MVAIVWHAKSFVPSSVIHVTPNMRYETREKSPTRVRILAPL